MYVLVLRLYNFDMMKKMKTLLILALLAVSGWANAQSIKVKVKGYADSTMYLIRYYGEKLYYADTAQADKNGLVSFDPSWVKKPGMYAVMDPTTNRFEILLNNEDVYIETDPKNYVRTMDIKKSKENKLFYEYIEFIGAKRTLAEKYKKEKEAATDPKKKEELEGKLKAIDEQVVAYQKDYVKNNKGTLAADVVNMSLAIDIPDAPKDENGVITDSSFQRNYYITHYWDHYDLKNDAIVRMGGFHRQLENMFENIMVKHPDSLIEYADRLISKMEDGSEVFKYTVVHLTSKYQKSKIMCLDNVFVHMVLKYYKTGRAYWMSEDKNKEIVERAEAMAPNLCGETPHNIALMDSAENWPRLYDVGKKYTILMFWSPDCGHCKKEMPKLVKKYNEWKKENMDIEIYAVSSINGKEWTDFIAKENMDWINVAVPEKVHAAKEEAQPYINKIVSTGLTDLKSLNYHDTFDIFKTPTIYLIDDKHEIIGKNLEAESLDNLLRKITGKEKAEEG